MGTGVSHTPVDALFTSLCLPFAWNPLRRKTFTLRASVARIPPVCCTACVYKAVLVALCVSAYASPEGLGRVGF